MAIKVGINGYGRIRLDMPRTPYDVGRNEVFDIVAINDRGKAKANACRTHSETVDVTALDSKLRRRGGKPGDFAVRVPTISVAMVDLAVRVSPETTVEVDNAALWKVAEDKSKNALAYRAWYGHSRGFFNQMRERDWPRPTSAECPKPSREQQSRSAT